MTAAPARLAEYLRRLPGRCRACVWHVPTQGHKPGCELGIRDERKRARR